MTADEAELLVVGHVHHLNMVIRFLRAALGAASLAALRDLMTVGVQGDAVPCFKDMKFVRSDFCDAKNKCCRVIVVVRCKDKPLRNKDIAGSAARDATAYVTSDGQQSRGEEICSRWVEVGRARKGNC